MCKYALGVKFYLKCAAATESCKFHSHFDYTNPREYVFPSIAPRRQVQVRVSLRGQQLKLRCIPMLLPHNAAQLAECHAPEERRPVTRQVVSYINQY